MDVETRTIVQGRACAKCAKPTPCDLVSDVKANGTRQVYWRCQFCGGIAKGLGQAGQWIGHQALRDAGVDPESLPVVNDYTPDVPACEHCGRTGTELHHWAPRAVFPDADFWPTAYLCRECHAKWESEMAAKAPIAYRSRLSDSQVDCLIADLERLTVVSRNCKS